MAATATLPQSSGQRAAPGSWHEAAHCVGHTKHDLATIAGAIQVITVERDTVDGEIEVTAATPTDLWRPERGDTVVVAIGPSDYLKGLVEAQHVVLAEELGMLVDRRLTVDDLVRQQARGRPRR